MELKEDMYVRTKYGITQYKEYDTTIGKLVCMFVQNGTEGIFADIEDIIGKPSFDIIDLIKVGDYVNGEKVIALREEIDEKNIYFNNKNCNIFTDYSIVENYYFGIEDKDIKSVVTREQFEAISYKVGE